MARVKQDRSTPPPPLTFFAPGRAKPKGSPQVVTYGAGGRPLRYPKVLGDTAESRAWQKAVAGYAQIAMRGREMFIRRPLAVELIFLFARPKIDFVRSTRDSANPRLAKTHPDLPFVMPDLDKLERCVLDGLNDIVFDDDARIVYSHKAKEYVIGKENEGVFVRVQQIGQAHRTIVHQLREACGLQLVPVCDDQRRALIRDAAERQKR